MLAITNATILTGLGNILENATLVLNNGKIENLGFSISIPSNYEVIDATGKYITPGLIDVHTHLGVHEEGIGKEGHDFNETTSATPTHVRALDGINPREKGFDFARKAGVTTVQIMPGSANVLGGEMVVLKTIPTTIVDEMILLEPSGMKAAFGENPKKVHGSKGKFPETRMGVAALFREQLVQAQNYLDKKRKNNETERDLKMENLAKVLTGKMPIRAHAHRADDIVTVLRLRKEFDIDITIEHCTEGHLIADFLAKQEVRVSVGPTMSSRSKVETSNKGWETLYSLAEAGVAFSLTTDHPVVSIDYLWTSVIHAVKHGITEELALKSVTLHAAKHLDLDDRIGSLEIGKDADVTIWSGNPFDLRSHVEKTIINGTVVYQQ
ncbi:amidohydrolase [Sutcliffiella halmapala]|uniref:amidohydrolase n=1 Tax=Sutcliffiella halmapala TaxID=79882 RepID=UPI000994AC43|nr:amidohydrolase [Sutcliffiella halmapala]